MGLESNLRSALAMVAERSVSIAGACANEESAKLYLVLPVIGALGYDFSNPEEVKPEYVADFRDEQANKVDYAILRDGNPIIAIECKRVGSNLEIDRGQLRAYFSALPTVKLGILTDGLRFEFYVDSENQNIMDAEPFMVLDMESIARGVLADDSIISLALVTSAGFDPARISESAQLHLVRRRLRTALVEELRDPSEELCRSVLQKIGMKNIRRSIIDSHYRNFIKLGFEEAIVLPVLERLRLQNAPIIGEGLGQSAAGQRITTTERELAIFRYVRRRLAFLSNDEQQFMAIEAVEHRDYIGKFAIYYKNVRKGRIFDFIEGQGGYDKFVFPEPFGEIVTQNIIELDKPLQATFVARVRELGAYAEQAGNQGQAA